MIWGYEDQPKLARVYHYKFPEQAHWIQSWSRYLWFSPPSRVLPGQIRSRGCYRGPAAGLLQQTPRAGTETFGILQVKGLYSQQVSLSQHSEKLRGGQMDINSTLQSTLHSTESMLLFCLETEVLHNIAQYFAWVVISPSLHQADFACISSTNISIIMSPWLITVHCVTTWGGDDELWGRGGTAAVVAPLVDEIFPLRILLLLRGDRPVHQALSTNRKCRWSTLDVFGLTMNPSL